MRFYSKFCLIFPVFIWFFFQIKLFRYYSKFKKNNLNLTEEERYLWVRRYSKFLCWLFSINKKIDLNFWNEKKMISIVKTDSIYKPLILISKNNFDYQLPLSIVINKKDFNYIPNYLVKFYSLIECYFITNETFYDEILKKMIEEVKIPRVLFYFAKNIEIKIIQKFIKISKETFSKLVSVTFFKNKLIIKIENKPNDFIPLNSEILAKRISIFINE